MPAAAVLRHQLASSFCRGEVDLYLLNLARELEWQLVRKVHRRADVLADVEALAERELDGIGPWAARPSAIFLPLAVMVRSPPLPPPDLPSYTKSTTSFVLPFGSGSLRRERGPIEVEEVVHERRLPVAQIQAEAALQSAVR